ncbi:MAG: YihY family inner membrane protein [Nitrospiraceae bacterium]|nr:YihY family inner membrane protein [Nitrospiraceae bacterium]
MALLPEKIDSRIRKKLTPAGEGPQGFFTSFLRIFYVLVNGFFDEKISLMAAGLVYTTLLNLVPLLAVGFSVLKAFGVSTRLEIMLYYFLEPLGEKGADISMTVISFVEHMNVAVLGTVGLVTLLYTVVSTVSRIESALNSIWHVKETRPLSQRFSAYLSIVLVGPVFIFAATSLIVSLKSSFVVSWVLSFPGVGVLAYIAGKILPYLFAAAAFALIYIFLPHARVRLGPALAGGCSAAAAWGAIGWAFASFVATSSRYSAMYSGLAALFLFLIWVYWNWVVLLAGATVTFVRQHPAYFGQEEREGPAERFRERAVLRMLAMIGRNFYSGKPPWGAASLSSHLDIPLPLLQDLLGMLAGQGVLTLTAGEPPFYIFARDPETISLDEIIAAVRKDGAAVSPQDKKQRRGKGIDAVMQDIDEAISAVLRSRSVKELVDASAVEDPGALP